MTTLHSLSGSTRSMLEDAGLDVEEVLAIVRLAIEEDLRGGRDVTTESTIPESHRTRGAFVSRGEGVVAGLPAACAVLDLVVGPENVTVEIVAPDASHVGPGDVLAYVTAPTRGLLTAERTALNLLCHLSGVATLTRTWADALEGTGARVRDTRKTMPGLRSLEKHAVRCGGGVNHRMGLSDMALVKDNHVAAAGGIEAAIRAVRAVDAGIPVEVEVDSLDALRVAIAAGVDEILIDNFTAQMMRAAVEIRDVSAPDVRLEASGGLTTETAREVAETGVDLIAVGELTHSARVLDIGLDLESAIGG